MSKAKDSKDKDYFFKHLKKHLKADPSRLEVIEQSVQPYERPNLQLAIQEMLSADGVEAELEGVLPAEEYHSVSLAKLSRGATAREVLAGPVEYHDVEVAD